MNFPPDLVTVYRSMDATAKEDCETILEILNAEDITAFLVDDSAPGIPEGTYEVRVQPRDAARAEKVIEENPLADEVEEVDNSPALDLETVFRAEGSSTTAEIEAMSVKNLLESNGLAAVLVGNSVLPNLPFEVRVAHEQAARARKLIEDAEIVGLQAADAESDSQREPKS